MPSVSVRIHPTALIDPQAELADDVTVGPFAIIEGPVRLGPGCVVRTAPPDWPARRRAKQ